MPPEEFDAHMAAGKTTQPAAAAPAPALPPGFNVHGMTLADFDALMAAGAPQAAPVAAAPQAQPQAPLAVQPSGEPTNAIVGPPPVNYLFEETEFEKIPANHN